MGQWHRRCCRFYASEVLSWGEKKEFHGRNLPLRGRDVIASVPGDVNFYTAIL
jgi:hypothetical protein